MYGVVKQSDGHIWVYSEMGQGTTFKIYLPRVFAPAEKDIHREAPSRLAEGTETILLVEDEEALRTLARDLLLECKYQVIEARDGLHALELGARCNGRIHLLLTDVVMPGVAGPEVAKKVTERWPNTKVLYMSGYTENSIVHNGVLDEGTFFLSKPFTPSGLTNKVREVLDHREAGHSN